MSKSDLLYDPLVQTCSGELIHLVSALQELVRINTQLAEIKQELYKDGSTTQGADSSNNS